jgi:hypothetical protein
VPTGEVLLVGAPDLRARHSRWTVAAEVPPDVVVVRADPADLPEIAKTGRLAIMRLEDGSTRMLGDEDALDELDEGARLFVSAWRARPLEKPDRPGEGLPWDSPGFEAPGPPDVNESNPQGSEQ